MPKWTYSSPQRLARQIGSSSSNSCRRRLAAAAALHHTCQVVETTCHACTWIKITSELFFSNCARWQAMYMLLCVSLSPQLEGKICMVYYESWRVLEDIMCTIHDKEQSNFDDWCGLNGTQRLFLFPWGSSFDRSRLCFLSLCLSSDLALSFLVLSEEALECGLSRAPSWGSEVLPAGKGRAAELEGPPDDVPPRSGSGSASEVWSFLLTPVSALFWMCGLMV